MMKRLYYVTDDELIDKQWEQIAPLFPILSNSVKADKNGHPIELVLKAVYGVVERALISAV